jgi:heme A synthase
MNDLIARELRASTPAAGAAGWLSLLSASALISTILLIMVGSFVRVSGNGLGCPDWPLCYGQAVPPLKWSAWVEFGHRIFGALVSAQIAAVAVIAWLRFRHEKWIVRPAVAAGALLLLQVGLGGLHVLNELPAWTGLVHTGVAMAITGLLAALSAVTRPSFVRLWTLPLGRAAHSRLAGWSWIAAGAVYGLLLTGSLVTRTGSSLACPSFPLCGEGNVQPYVTIQMVHRAVAFTVAFLALFVALRLFRRGEGRPFRPFAWTVVALIALQFALGIGNVLLKIPMWTRILHLGTGATLWAAMVILAVVLHMADRPEVRPDRSAGGAHTH